MVSYLNDKGNKKSLRWKLQIQKKLGGSILNYISGDTMDNICSGLHLRLHSDL